MSKDEVDIAIDSFYIRVVFDDRELYILSLCNLLSKLMGNGNFMNM